MVTFMLLMGSIGVKQLSKAKYPQYLDMSKALKMLLLDIIDDSKTLIIIREQLNTVIA